MVTTVTGKLQVTVPAKLAHALGVKPGTRLIWEKAGREEIRVRVLEAGRVVPEPPAPHSSQAKA